MAFHAAHARIEQKEKEIRAQEEKNNGESISTQLSRTCLTSVACRIQPKLSTRDCGSWGFQVETRVKAEMEEFRMLKATAKREMHRTRKASKSQMLQTLPRKVGNHRAIFVNKECKSFFVC